jgi:hypothetical protein
MIHVPITLSENVTLNTRLQPVSISIPFKSDEVFNINTLSLVNEKQQLINSQITPIAFWPNKSIKWVRVNFIVEPNPDGFSAIYLTETIKNTDDTIASTLHIPEQSYNSIEIEENEQSFNISTGAAIFQLDKHELGIFTATPSINKKKQPLHKSENHSLILTDKANRSYYPTIKEIHFSSLTEKEPNKLQLTTYISGCFQTQNNTSILNFSAEIIFYANEAYTKWSVTLHNPNSMVHSGGTWDLGNENSLHFTSFNAKISCKNTANCSYKLATDDTSNINTDWHENINKLTIFQASSGGDNWQSNNHVNNQGVVPIEFNGYKISSNRANEEIKGRATPFVFIEQGEQVTSGLSVYIKDFWQKFPKSINVNENNVVLGLFPEQAKDGFELQPGEKKTDTFYLSYSNDKEALSFIESPITASISAEYLAATKTVPFLTASNNEYDFNDIINDGLNSNNSFFHKRELIDEFGWRNFGDLYADHETLECDSNDELISHYNNQYDPLYGFLRQYLLTHDQRWLTLANDLADHVKNIDIYHTTQDKAEYNGGLFWHTDHYLPAETASHRTYSKHQKNDAYQDHAGGGGPGGQHCYTSGLMLHYFLTGEETSKNAVLQLTNWITNVYEGSGTLTDFLLAIKNKNRLDVKSVFTGKYPLDRGTGHYIFALIDSFELTGKQSYLDRASLVIKNTVHPEDDIKERSLDNVEECWFYTIFFQAVYRYLLVKQNNDQLDASFQYARASLQHFAIWMCEHEHPYLDKPDILEYPNHTWAAQDIRKANVLYMASYFANNQDVSAKCKTKADDIYNYVVKTFSEEPTRKFTRILSILMQNHGVKSYVEQAEDILLFSQKPTLYSPYGNSHKDKTNNNLINKHLLDAFVTTLSNTSLSNELAWLRKRSSSVDSFLTKLGK